MPRLRAFLGAALLLSLSLGGCAPARPVIHSSPAPDASASRYAASLADAALPGLDRHVVVVSIDGLRPDAIDRFGARTLQRLIREGSYSATAQTIVPSITLPSHTSMITGSSPDVHGITWNDNRVEENGTVRVATMFRTAKDWGLRTAAFASKGKFNHLFTPRDLHDYMVPHGNGSWASGRTAKEVKRYLQENRPNLLFVHLREPDRYGHVFGWMGTLYGWAVRRADDALETVVEAADEAFGRDGYTLIVTADHGGHGRDHGHGTDADRTIPWIAWGAGVAPNAELGDGIRTMDTAATALWLLGVPQPETAVGMPVEAAFRPDGVLAGADNEDD